MVESAGLNSVQYRFESDSAHQNKRNERTNHMTKFDRTKFTYHGGYLNYVGDYIGAEFYEEGPNVHPSRVGTQIPLFIARFKHRGPVTKAKFLTQLIKRFSVEHYAGLLKEMPPVTILKGDDPAWYDKIMRKLKYA